MRTSKIPVGERVIMLDGYHCYAVDVVESKTLFEGEPDEFTFYRTVGEIRCDTSCQRHRNELYRKDEIGALEEQLRHIRSESSEYLAIVRDLLDPLELPYGDLIR